MKRFSVLLAAAALAVVSCAPQDKWAALNSRAADEYDAPVRPFYEGRNPCWNGFSNKFTYAPAFDFEAVEGASVYRFTVSDKAGGGSWSFTSPGKDVSLAPVWRQIPPCNARLVVEALDEGGAVLDTAFVREFLRDFPFEGPYNTKVRPYREAAMMAALYVHNMKAVQHWKGSTEPDMSYAHNTYPNKIIGGTISLETLIARHIPTLRDEALQIARNAAQFLIDMSRPGGDPLEFFPPTYYKDLQSSGQEWNRGKIMIMDPCMAGNAFLDLFDATGDSLYFDRALKIASTYVRIQRPDGSFPIKADFATGEPVNEACAMLHPILEYVRRLQNDYSVDGLEDMRVRAQDWMTRVAVETFDFTGQFEDVNVQGLKPYQNLTNVTASHYVSYLMTNPSPSKEDIAASAELLRMGEDQFVHWNELPNAYGIRTLGTPSVFEQHKYQMPVDASSCSMANAWLDYWEVTGDALAFEKAKALIDNLTVQQDMGNGRIPTTFQLRSPEKDLRRTFWINCDLASVKTLLRMAEIEEGSRD
ncbi:MAG: hypothetical protein IJS66_00615 [Bacteroidales bacterium]|nr:hypothetical protein [Bacteroidales bacterium]